MSGNLAILVALGAEDVDEDEVGVVLQLGHQAGGGQHDRPQAEDLAAHRRVGVLAARHQVLEHGAEVVLDQLAGTLQSRQPQRQPHHCRNRQPRTGWSEVRPPAAGPSTVPSEAEASGVRPSGTAVAGGAPPASPARRTSVGGA